MTTEEIKKLMDAQGWTISALAEELSINHINLGRILAGQRPLTSQLEKHIEYVLGARKSQMMIFTVDLPDATCRKMFPGWDALTEEEKRKAVGAVFQSTIDELVAMGRAKLTQEELEKLKSIAGM